MPEESLPSPSETHQTTNVLDLFAAALQLCCMYLGEPVKWKTNRLQRETNTSLVKNTIGTKKKKKKTEMI